MTVNAVETKEARALSTFMCMSWGQRKLLVSKDFDQRWTFVEGSLHLLPPVGHLMSDVIDKNGNHITYEIYTRAMV